VFKIFRGYENINNDIFPTKSQSNLSAHSLKSTKKHWIIYIGKCHFSKWVINRWNASCGKIIESGLQSLYGQGLKVQGQGH